MAANVAVGQHTDERAVSDNEQNLALGLIKHPQGLDDGYLGGNDNLGQLWVHAAVLP